MRLSWRGSPIAVIWRMRPGWLRYRSPDWRRQAVSSFRRPAAAAWREHASALQVGEVADAAQEQRWRRPFCEVDGEPEYPSTRTRPRRGRRGSCSTSSRIIARSSRAERVLPGLRPTATTTVHRTAAAPRDDIDTEGGRRTAREAAATCWRVDANGRNRASRRRAALGMGSS